MNPSILFKAAGRTVCVIHEHEHGCKKDSQGRRIPGSTRTGAWVGTRVGWYDQARLVDARELPPTASQEAVKQFLSGR